MYIKAATRLRTTLPLAKRQARWGSNLINSCWCTCFYAGEGRTVASTKCRSILSVVSVSLCTKAQRSSEEHEALWHGVASQSTMAADMLLCKQTKPSCTSRSASAMGPRAQVGGRSARAYYPGPGVRTLHAEPDTRRRPFRTYPYPYSACGTPGHSHRTPAWSQPGKRLTDFASIRSVHLEAGCHQKHAAKATESRQQTVT